MNPVINEKPINDFLLELLRKYPGISELWFVGSRANNKDVEDTSDWDFIVRCEKEVFPFLSKDEELKVRAKFLKIDLLLDIDGGDISSPWEKKRINKKDLQWFTLSKNKAKYWGAKTRARTGDERVFLSDWEKYAIEHGADDSVDVSDWCLAMRVWPNEK
jgi:predicted nucleotidyltransferase